MLIHEMRERRVIVEHSGRFVDMMPEIFRDDVCIFVSHSGNTEVIKILIHNCCRATFITYPNSTMECIHSTQCYFLGHRGGVGVLQGTKQRSLRRGHQRCGQRRLQGDGVR